MAAIFGVHARDITNIINRTLKATSEHFKNKLNWPTPEEITSYKERFKYFQNPGFEDVLFVIDGTELAISRPSNHEQERRHYSPKKKQHSLNLMVITLLNGYIVYYSVLQKGAHDQRDWNNLELRNLFKDKLYGIIGDGEFTFNTKSQEDKIIGFTPVKKSKKKTLNPDEEKFNSDLSSMRIVVENTMARIKIWRIMKEVYRGYHFNSSNSIYYDDVVNWVIYLTNQKISECPIRNDDYMSREWKRMFSVTNLFD